MTGRRNTFQNNGAFATIFDSNGIFVNPVSSNGLYHLLPVHFQITPTLTMFSKEAFLVLQSGTVTEYAVFIVANNTRYAVGLDTSGNFLSGKTVY